MNLDRERLIIFTRYPEPGKTKTRMIPVLGAQGAAQLQRQMTENTLKVSQLVKLQRDLSLTVYFTGGSLTLMQEWLGEDLTYSLQSQGDLGEKLQSALLDSFNQGMTRVVFIGVDCPDLTEAMINQAFESLKTTDLVIGPAVDGGYYLIGLGGNFPQLFQGINWGTEVVFAQTQKVAQQLNLGIDYLPMLADVDRPDDLGRVGF